MSRPVAAGTAQTKNINTCSVTGERTIVNMPERRLEPPEPRITAICKQCGGEIYDGEIYGLWDGDPICRYCAADTLEHAVAVEDYRLIYDWLGCEVVR